MAMPVHEVEITRSQLDMIRRGEQVQVRTDKQLAVLLSKSSQVPADKNNVDGRGTIWLPVNDFMISELLTGGHSGLSPNYTLQVAAFGVHLID